MAEWAKVERYYPHRPVSLSACQPSLAQPLPCLSAFLSAAEVFLVCLCMSAEEAQLSGASYFTLPLDRSNSSSSSSPYLRSTDMREDGHHQEDKGQREEVDSVMKWQSKLLATAAAAAAATGSTDASEESEPESPSPSAYRRKVSFADAFGLNLVSVKEFSSLDSEGKVEDYLCGLDADEFYLSCMFTMPTPMELTEKVEKHKLALESVALQEGTTTLRGTVRVANLCFQKTVYVRYTYDDWQTHFDLLAEYVPGSSDRDSDGFSFRLTIVPPLEPEGVRVEFCLRYETPFGEFWENNNNINYVLYCCKRLNTEKKEKGDKKERGDKKEKGKSPSKDKETKANGKRSCLKVPR